MTIKTEQDLRKHLNLGEGELINTNKGALDIFSVKGGVVSYGFLIGGSTQTENIDDFLSHFPPDFGKNKSNEERNENGL